MKWREKSKKSLNVRMKHDDDDGVNKTQTWATLCASMKEDSQRTTTVTENKKRDYENEGSSMHEDSCIGINYAQAHMFPKCFRSLHTLLGFALYFMSSILILVTVAMNSIYDLNANSLWRFTLRKRVFWGVVFALPFGCSRPPSVVNDPMETKLRTKTNSWKSFVWGFIQRRNTTDFPVLSYRFACILIYRLSLNYYEDHQDPLHCHQLEEELDDGCRSWYFQ